MNKENILYNTEISNIVKDFYLGNIDEITIGDKYYSFGLYSSASGFYGAYLNQHYDDIDVNKKSVVLTKLARCYLNQLDENYSDWQMNITYSLLKYAIIYNPNNIFAHYTLALCYVKKNERKEACFEYEYVVMNYDKTNIKEYYENNIEIINNSIINAYRLSNEFKSVKFNSFNKKVLKYLNDNIENITLSDYKLIMNEIYLNSQRVSEFEQHLLNL